MNFPWWRKSTYTKVFHSSHLFQWDVGTGNLWYPEFLSLYPSRVNGWALSASILWCVCVGVISGVLTAADPHLFLTALSGQTKAGNWLIMNVRDCSFLLRLAGHSVLAWFETLHLYFSLSTSFYIWLRKQAWLGMAVSCFSVGEHEAVGGKAEGARTGPQLRPTEAIASGSR